MPATPRATLSPFLMARRHSAVVLAHLATNIDQTTPSETKIDNNDPKIFAGAAPILFYHPSGPYLRWRRCANESKCSEMYRPAA